MELAVLIVSYVVLSIPVVKEAMTEIATAALNSINTTMLRLSRKDEVNENIMLRHEKIRKKRRNFRT